MAWNDKDSFERVLSQCWNLTGFISRIIPLRHSIARTFFEFILELVLAQCSNLTGFILDLSVMAQHCKDFRERSEPFSA